MANRIHKFPERTGKPDNSVDFNKLRKRRQRLTTVRRLFLLAGVILLVLGVVLLNNLLVENSVTTRISDMVQGMGGSGYPTRLPGGVIRDMKSVGDHLAVLNDTNLYIYSPKGKQVGNFQRMSESTVLLATSGRTLTYSEGAKQFGVHSRSKTLLEQELEYGIITADLNERGDYAIVSSSNQFICEINVYNKRFEKTYKCNFVDNIVHAVSLSPKGNAMAAGWLNGQDGTLHAGVDIYRLSSDQVAASLELPDNLILDVRFLEEDRIGVLTDQQCLLMGADGEIRKSYRFDGRQLIAVEREGRNTLLLFEDRDTRQREVVLLDSELEEKAVHVTGDKVLDMALSSRRIYLLGEDAIRSYDLTMTPAKTDTAIPVQHVSRIQLAGSKLYYLTREEICVVGQAPVEETAPDGETGEADDPADTEEQTGDTERSATAEATEATGKNGGDPDGEPAVARLAPLPRDPRWEIRG